MTRRAFIAGQLGEDFGWRMTGSTWSDVSSGNHGPEAEDGGTLVLRTGDWGSGQPILGKVWLGPDAPRVDDGEHALWFQMRDPFVPPLAPK
jgi:hypothetical protein